MSSELITCEVCPNQVEQSRAKKFRNMVICEVCYQKELKYEVEKYNNSPEMSPEKQQERVTAANPWNATLQKAREIDQEVEVRTDLFNAATVALIEIQGAITNDPNIPQDKKHFIFIKTIEQRIEEFQKKIFELGEEMVKRQTELRSAVTMFNNEVIKLRQEERAQFKLQSINYDPKPLKKVSDTKPKSPAKKSLDKSGIRTAAAVIQQFITDNKIPLGIKVDESMVQIVCVSQNLTPDQAIEYYKEKFRPMIPAK